jgi:hypothetical protein
VIGPSSPKANASPIAARENREKETLREDPVPAEQERDSQDEENP